MTKQKCYIAGKIGNLPEKEWKKNFEIARKEVYLLGHHGVCPTLLNHYHDKTWRSYMQEDIAAMMKCSIVYAQRNWQDSQGATIEVNLAKDLGWKLFINQK